MCPTCGGDGDCFRATPLAEARHFGARTIWAMHRLRLALVALGRPDRAMVLSALVQEVEALTEDTRPPGDS